MTKLYEKKIFRELEIFPKFEVIPSKILIQTIKNSDLIEFDINSYYNVPSFMSKIYSICLYRINEKILGFNISEKNSSQNNENLILFPEEDLLTFETLCYETKEDINVEHLLFRDFFTPILKRENLPYFEFDLNQYSQNNKKEILETLSKSNHLYKVLKNINLYLTSLYTDTEEYYVIEFSYDTKKEHFCPGGVITEYPLTTEQNQNLKSFIYHFVKDISFYKILPEGHLQKNIDDITVYGDYFENQSISFHEMLKIKKCLIQENFDLSLFNNY